LANGNPALNLEVLIAAEALRALALRILLAIVDASPAAFSQQNPAIDAPCDV